jgi:hypothetical protein
MNLETYREKALKCARAADEVDDTAERAGLLGLASIYTALADYVDGPHQQGPTCRADQDQDPRKTVEQSASRRPAVSHLEFGLIVFLALAATQFFMWLAIRGPALLERSASWQPLCFLVLCETQPQPHRQAQARPEPKSQSRLQPQSQALLQFQAQPQIQPRPRLQRHPPPRPHMLDGMVVSDEPQRRSKIECWRDRSIRGPCFD